MLVTGVAESMVGPGPLAKRLADALIGFAETGVLQPDERLPAERELAIALGVSRTTVTSAYAHMRGVGWIQTAPGRVARIGRQTRMSATMSPSERLDDLFPLGATIDLTTSSPGAAPVVRKLFANLAEFVDLASLTAGHGYAPFGVPELVEAVVDHLRADGIDAAPKEIVITSGGQQALGLIAQALGGSGRPLAVESLAYPGLFDAVGRSGSPPIALPLGDRGLDVTKSLRLVAAGNVTGLFISQYQNPTGHALPEASADRLVVGARKRGALVVEDRTLAHVVLNGSPPAALAPGSPGSVITVGGLSKVVWGGLRVGWIHANATLASHLRDRRAAHDLGTPTPQQHIAATLLRNHFDTTRRWRTAQLQRSLAAFNDALRAHSVPWSFTTPEGGPNLWVDTGRAVTPELLRRCADHGVALIAGPAFIASAASGNHDRHIRIPLYRTPHELKQAVAIVSAEQARLLQ
jgi:DNA-binding transcriptional MocR family regulator